MQTVVERVRRVVRRVRIHSLLLLGCLVAITSTSSAMPSPPDLCTTELTPGSINVRNVPAIGDSLRVRWVNGNQVDRKVAIIFNGNSYGSADYVDLAEHLALNGFVAAIAQRPGGNGGDGAYVIDAILGTLNAVNIDPTDSGLAIALIGHSMGGQLVVTGAMHNQTLADPLPIRAVVGLSPRAAPTSVLDASASPAYLGIYGSQDEDLEGFLGTPREAFRLYDQASTEGTTTCNSPPCILLSPVQDKTNIFVNGADHAGLIGKAFHLSFPPLPQSLDYIDAADQLCLVQAYVTSFLRWRLFGEGEYKAILRDDVRPTSVDNMVTADVDFIGNPVGTPIRIASQISPPFRRVINNFETGATPSAIVGPATVLDGTPGDLAVAPHFVRHFTGTALVGWQPAMFGSRVVWNVPANAQVGSTYTHFSIRMGLFQGAAAPFDNQVGGDRQVQVWLRDGFGSVSQHTLTIPYGDPYTPDGRTRSTMSTFRIPVDEIQGIDLDDVSSIELALSPFLGGALIVDSIEWHRD